MSELSVIVPVYKAEAYLQQCVDSILEQTFQDFELILVDDGSPDRCAEICDVYAEKDLRVKVIHQENLGAVTARETGLAAATGEFVIFPDSDDWMDSDMLERIMKLLHENEADIVCVGFMEEGETAVSKGNGLPSGVYDLGNPETRKSFLKKALYTGTFYEAGIIPSLWSKIIRKDLFFRDTQPPDPMIKMGDDAARLYPALVRAGKVVVQNECRPYHYRVVAGSQAHSYDPLYFKRAEKLLSGLKENLTGYPEMMNSLTYYALFILQLGIDLYLFENRKVSIVEIENVLNGVLGQYRALGFFDAARIDWSGFSKDMAEKMKSFVSGELKKMISLYRKKHFTARVRSVLSLK